MGDEGICDGEEEGGEGDGWAHDEAMRMDCESKEMGRGIGAFI